MNAEEYCDIIMNEEMFDFQLEGSEDLGCLLMIEDGVGYHKGCAAVRRKQLKKDRQVG